MASSCQNINDCRTLWEIIWSCIATLIACTWVSVHPNVPDPDHGSWWLAFHRLNLMLLSIIAPEIVVLWALRQRMVASQLRKEYGLSMAHGFFLSMGGFVKAQGHILKPIVSHDVLPGGTVDVGSIFDVDVDEIIDHSKGDEITKGLALLQTVWFIIQCIARASQHLPLTEIEVVTLAFAALNIVIRLVWWQKPLDVRYPVRIGPKALRGGGVQYQKREPFAPTRRKAIEYAFNYCVNITVRIFEGEEHDTELPHSAIKVPTLWAGRLCAWDRGVTAILAVFLAMGFGAIHFGAWDIVFPTTTERILWRASSIAIVTVPFVFMMDATLILSLGGVPPWYNTLTFRLVIPLGMLTYIIARILLMVLPFTSLRDLPPNAYKDVDWSSFIPHIS
ncbi:hypothetical protein BDZ94DRAFT_1313790 [Collybia nuda]|uniref:Uncharacterized protein n=1 Tax=Collybia nuda TaxID=64659 RepID=A0A9P5XW25_9AGAR|nr:hypothetical protein BDZ94DRAFT_1313790 [Collybia nuda]